jgi:uncharacterized membrane protein HdeD (DUF308 family)
MKGVDCMVERGSRDRKILLVGGVFQAIRTLTVKTWSGFLLAMLGGIVYAIGGILIMDEPVQGALVITLFLIAGLVIGGVLRIVVALRHREMVGWWLMAVSGL